MIAIAVTGGIACGKSLVGRILAGNGFEVCEADDLAHGLLEPGLPVYRRVVDCFGQRILDRDARINRRRLAKLVFSKPSEREKLNRIVHPPVKRAWKEWLRRTERSGKPRAVVVPLLYEAGAGSGWDAVICVAASEKSQMRRLRERGLSEVEARQRLRAQMSVQEKMRLADYVIMNDGNMDVLVEQVMRVKRRMLEA